MSGHSRWSQIKHKKDVVDQKRGQVFSKLANKITIAARGGIDPSGNYRLKSAIDEARAANVPKENVERAIKRAAEKDSVSLEEVVIQAMGLGGIAVVVEAITDNKNRTISEIRRLLAEHKFKMVPENSLNWMFNFTEWTPNETARARSVPLSRTGWTPVAPIEASTEAKERLDKLLQTLGENEDAENVFTNLRSD